MVGGIIVGVVGIAGIPADDVQLDKSFTDDLDVDSLSMVEVVVAAEMRKEQAVTTVQEARAAGGISLPGERFCHPEEALLSYRDGRLWLQAGRAF